MNPSEHGLSLFELRRRKRRFRMIVDLTRSIISRNPDLSHREARCLVSCARKAILDLSPAWGNEFESVEQPRLEEMIRSRWPLEEFDSQCTEDVVN